MEVTLRIEERNEVYAIIASKDESFWDYQVIDPARPTANRPKLKLELKEWWDVTAPGQWTTSYLEKFTKAILIRDPRLFQLFKLAWQNHPRIQRTTDSPDSTFIYCPYVPLVHSPGAISTNDNF